MTTIHFKNGTSIRVRDDYDSVTRKIEQTGGHGAIRLAKFFILVDEILYVRNDRA